LFQFPPHLKKNHLVFQRKKTEKKTCENNDHQQEKKNQVKKKSWLKKCNIFCVLFSRVLCKDSGKNSRKQNGCFLVKKKNRKEKKMKENPPNKKWLPVFTS